MAKEGSDEVEKLEERGVSEFSKGEESGSESNEISDEEGNSDESEEINNSGILGDLRKEELSKDQPSANNGNKEQNKLQGPSKEKRKMETLNIIKNIFPFKSSEKSVPSTATRGIKRSQGKPNLIRSCKRKKLTLGKKDSKKDGPGLREEDALADNECSDDSDSEGWQILEEESDKDLDKALEENASRNKLTAYNVKAILHQVITNEHVVAMVKNTILNEVASKEELKEATYEPKMTRATVKKAIEEKGDVMHPWPLTPLKKKTEEVKTILDIELSEEEEEEDDDYSPDKEKEGSFSDEDSESVTSSQMSDFGSPCPSTPATPRTPTSSVGLTLDTRNAPSTEKGYKGPFLSPMGPPSKLPLYRQSLSKKFQEVEDMSEKTKEDQTIAARTRSKLSLEDTSIIELESTFVPPDFTPDMYDNECEDEDWQGFLQSLYKPPESENTNDGMDDEEKDPEYNYLAEIDELIDSDEELRNDRAVKISKKEMNTLMDELFEYYQETQPLEEDEKKAMKIKAKTHYKRQVSETEGQEQSTENQCYVMSDQEREQIGDQMRKHVQLLSQMYVSAMGNQAEYKEVADYSKNLLVELHQFSVTNSQYLTPNSMYSAANLKEAVELVNKTEEWEQIERIKPNNRSSYISSEKSIASLLVQNYRILSKRKKDLILSIVGDAHSKTVGERLQSNRLAIPHFTNQQKQLIWNSPVFMYPELVPSGGFLFRNDLQETKRRVAFTESEDKLMALGLDQFKHLPYFHQLIRKFLLPCKTEDQIKVRIKNLTSSKASPNVIKNYKLTKKLPDFQIFTGVFSPHDMKPPKDQDIEKLPTWCKEHKIREIMASTDDDLEKNGSLQRSSSVNIPLMSTERGKVGESKSCSAPVTPMTKTQDQNRPSTVIIVPNLTPEKSSVNIVSQSPVTPAVEIEAKQSSLPLNAIPLSNISDSSGNNVGIPFSTNTLGIPLSCSQVSADQNFPCNMLPNQRSCIDSVNSISLPSECSKTVLPLNTSLSAIVPVSSVCSLNNSHVTSVPTLSSQTVSVPGLPVNTLTSHIVTKHMLSNQAVTSSSCLSMPSLSVQNCQESETLNKQSWTPTAQNSALLSNPLPHSNLTLTVSGEKISGISPEDDIGTTFSLSEHIQGEVQSSIGRPVLSERCISPDDIEPTVKMKNTEGDSNESDLSKEVIKKQMNMKCSDTVSESPSSQKKMPFSPGFIPLHQESGQNEIIGNPGSPILIRMVENVPSPVDQNKGKNNQSAEGNRNQNASVCERDLNAENRRNKERQSNVENVFFSDSALPDYSCVVQADVSDSSLDTTLVGADKSYNESPKPNDNSRETQTHAMSSVNSNSVNQSTNVLQISGKTISVTQHWSENSNSTKLLGIPIENKLHVNQLPSSSRKEEQESDKSKTSCRAHLIGSLSSLSSTQSKPLVTASPMKSALEIVAAYSSLMLSPKRGTASFVQKAQETTPVKSRYRPLAPKPFTSSAKVVSPFLSPKKSPRKSPRRQQLQRKARAICPKGLVVKSVISPSKKAASQIMNRVLGKTHCKILPRPPGLPGNDLHIQTRGLALNQVKVEPLKDETETEEEGMETASECDTVESEYLSDEVMEDVVDDKKQSARKNLQKKFHKNRELRNSVESDDTEVDDSNLYDSQDDNEEASEHIADLMAASTTIKFNPKNILSKDSKDISSKTKRRKDSALAMLAPDIVDTDPLKDDRDTAFAQAYLMKAAEDLKDDFATYEQFLKILYEFGKSEQSPVKLYREMRELLRNFPDLVEDFSAFLSPSQAVECGCFMENLRFRRARTFLRKLEVYGERHPSHYQKTMKILTKWIPGGAKKDEKALKETLEQVLKNQPHLLEELSLFFEDEKPPDSYMTEFEEITLGDSDEDEGFQFDDFEEVVIPEDENPDGSKKCMCTCHQNPNAKNFHMRNIHCTNCCLKVIDGELYYRINRQVLKKVRVKYHPEVKPKLSCSKEEEDEMRVKTEPMTLAQWEEDEEVAEKENVQIRRPKNMGIKLKISSRKKGKQGRFFSIKEMADSPVKKIIASVSTENDDDQTSDLENLPSTSSQPNEMSEEGEMNGEGESISTSRTDELERTEEYLEESQLSCGLPDLIPPQDQRRQEETNSGGEVEKTGETSPLSKVPRSVEVTVTADSNEDFAGAIISIPNTEMTSKKDSERKFTINSWMESANLSPQKTPPSLVEEVAVDGHISQLKDSSCSDLLAKALHEAMISQSDVSMTLDSSQLDKTTQSAPSPSKAPLSSTKQNLGFSIVSEKEFKNITQNIEKSDSEKSISPSTKQSASSLTDGQKKKVGEKRRIVPKPVTEETSCVSPAFSLSSIDNVEFLKSPTASSPIIAYTNSPVFHNENSNLSLKISPNPKSHYTEDSLSGSSAGQDLRLKLNRSQSVSSPSRKIISSVVGFGQEQSKTSASPCQVSDPLSEERATTPATPQIEWTRDMDRVMLESVKAHGPYSKTFDDIAKQIPGSTAASVIERFHTLLEMLADETPSEDDTTEDTTESSS